MDDVLAARIVSAPLSTVGLSCNIFIIMRLLQALGAALPLGLALGASTPNNLVVHEKRDVVPAHQWSKKSVAPHDLVFPVRLAISPRNVELGHEMLMNIASPNSPNLGQHWTPENVRDFFSPTRSTVSIIKTWLTSSGIHHSRLNLHGGRGHINFHATIGEMEKLLGTEYQLFENVETGDLTVSCDQYHVPESIQEHIDFISPTIGFDVNSVPALKKRSLTKRSHKPHWQGGLAGKPAVSKPMTWWPSDIDSLSNCSGLVTPACIKALDSIPQRNEAVFEGNDLGVYEFGDHYDQEDLNLFFAKYTPETPQGTHPSLDSIDGGTDPVNVTDAGGESVLDFELSFPIVYPQPI